MGYALSEHRFRAMNTEIAAWLWSDIGHAAVWLHEVEAFFGEVEAELIRFRPDSGLSRLNAAAGQGPQPVSEMLETVIALGTESRRGERRRLRPNRAERAAPGRIRPQLRAAGRRCKAADGTS